MLSWKVTASVACSIFAVTNAQLYNETFDPYNATLYQVSADPYFAFLLSGVLTSQISEGAGTGEVLRVALTLTPGNLDDYYEPWHWMADQMDQLASSINVTVDPVGAREAYFRASNYNRQSVSMAVANFSDPRVYSVWDTMQEQFAKAIALMKPAPGEVLNITAPNSSIGAFNVPGYFFKASAGNESLPTFIVGTGYDGPMQDLFHSSCGEILKRGVNCLVYEGPGQATPRRAGLGFIPDWYSVVTPIVDYLHTREDVDTDKIVLMGDSFGGTLAPLAAANEHRLAAMFLLDGLPSLRQAAEELYPSGLVQLFNQSNAAEFNKSIEAVLKSPDLPTSFKFIWIYTLWSMNELDPYKAFERLGQFTWGPDTAAAIGDLPVYVAKGQDDTSTTNEADLAYQYLVEGRPNGKNLTYFHEFPTALGAGEHTSLGAESQVYISVFAWLSQIWGGYKFDNGSL